MSRIGRFVAMTACVLVLAGCGKKTMPVPPRTVLPAAIDDLAFQLDEKGVTLSWTAPRNTEGGERLTGVDSYEVSRAVVPRDAFCPGCPLNYDKPRILETVGPGDGPQFFSEALLRPGHRYFYKVRARTGLMTAGDYSSPVSFVWETPPAAPENLRAESGDLSVTLTWQPPGEYLDGGPVDEPLLYQIFRRTESGRFAKLGEPIAGTSYRDSTVANTVRYAYQVRAVRMIENSELSGVASAAVEGAPQDRTAPAPPVGLAAETSRAGIRLSWDASDQSDLAGYRVYVRRNRDAAPSLLAETGADSTSYTDRGHPADREQRHYSITAFDGAGNESLPSLEVVVQAVP